MNKLNPKRYTLNASKSGFTIIELSVAMTLFVIVMGVSSGIFIRSLRSQRAIVDLIAINDNMSLTLEQMAREVRLGTCFVSDEPSELSFRNTYNQRVTYRLAQSSSPSSENQVFQRNNQAITGEDVDIDRLNFILNVQPNIAGDKAVARVTTILGIGSASPQLEGFLTNIQTTISSRIFYDPDSDNCSS